jgi:hypothetical protein
MMQVYSSVRWDFIFIVVSCLYTDREAMIESAIKEVERDLESYATKKRKLSAAEQMFSAYKKVIPSVHEHGIANLKFERMVKLAEKKIIRSQPEETAQAAEITRVGKVLSSKEIAHIYQASGCTDQIVEPDFCFDEYRSIDGTCNNPNDKILGAISTAFRRLLPPEYEDDVSLPRGFSQSQYSDYFDGPFTPPTPSPRVVVNQILVDEDFTDDTHTQLLMQFGQFLAHDIAMLTSDISPCFSSCEVTEELRDICYPIVLPASNVNVMETMGRLSSNCAVFPRSLAVCPSVALIGSRDLQRQQINGVTHYIDASPVYGNSNDTLRILRTDNPKGSLRVGDFATGMYNAHCMHACMLMYVCQQTREEPSQSVGGRTHSNPDPLKVGRL